MKSFSNDLFIIIPARNEEETLPSLLQKITSKITENVVVIDNNSSDHTYSVSKSFTKHVIKEIKLGYGNACLAGINYINHLEIRPQYVCFFDGDGQSFVSDITKIVSPLHYSDKISYCQGTRMVHLSSFRSLTGSAYVANKVFSSFLTKIWKQKVSDLGPLRCIQLDLLNKLNMRSKTYAWTIEMNTKLMKLQIPIVEIPVKYKIRSFGVSKISGSFKTSLQAATIMTISFIRIALFWSSN